MSGNLVVRPLTAKLTRDTETFGKMDPYVKVCMGQQFKRTAVCQDGGKTPGWKDELSFRYSGEDIITVEVWDKDSASKDDLVGTASVAFSTIVQKGNKLSEWITISYKGKSAGQILIDFQYFKDGGKADKGVFGQQQQQFAQPTTFGQPTTFPTYQQPTTFGQPTYVQTQPTTTFVQTQPTTTYVQTQTTYVPTQQQTTYVQQPQPTFIPQQQYPQQTFVQQSYPQQQFPQQQTFPQQQFQQQTYPQQQFQQQGYPQQQFQQQGYPGQFQYK